MSMSLLMVVGICTLCAAEAHCKVCSSTCNVHASLGSRLSLLDLSGVVSPSRIALLMSAVKASRIQMGMPKTRGRKKTQDRGVDSAR